MSFSISGLPVELRGLAMRIDQTPGVGNGDGVIDLAEIARARAATGYAGDDLMVMGRLEAWLTGPAAPAPAGATRPLGPDGRFDSTVFPAQDGLQREVIRLATDRNPGGLDLAATRGLELPRVLAGDGVVGVRVELSQTSRGNVAANIGSERLASYTGAPVAGVVPLHGPIVLTAGGSGRLLAVEVFHRVPTPLETSDYYPVNRAFRPGDVFEIDLSSHRRGMGLDQIENIWTASYSRPDPSGRKSDEGKPFYLDGVYAQLFLVDEHGREHQVDRTKFVDANEVDNSHDLGGLKGVKYRVKFSATSAEGKGHAITFRGVRLRFVDGSRPRTPAYQAAVGRIIEPGGRAEIELPAELRAKKIGRVEVRWTDMLSGTWTRPGYAYGTLVIDGKRVGPAESVQSPETQAFTHLSGAQASAGKIGVVIERDRARVDWIRVYFED